MIDQVEPLRPRATQIQVDLPGRRETAPGKGGRFRPSKTAVALSRRAESIAASGLTEAELRELTERDESIDFGDLIEAVPPAVVNDSPPLAPRIEFWNTVTHGLAAVLCVAGFFGIIARLGVSGATPLMWAAGLLYGLALVYLYAASALSHYFSWDFRPVARGYWRRQDQVGILLVAVMSFAPLAIHATGIGRIVLPAMAAAVITLLVALSRHEKRTINPIYLAQLGWLPPLATGDILAVGGPIGMLLAAGGGACYIGGLFFLFNDGRRWWFHPVWHLSAITGSAMHYAFLVRYCM